MLRYRLYDIDRIVNRTVVYAVLTALLGGGVGGRACCCWASALGQGSPWATAGATLVAAIAFRPLRARVQDAVDRRFDRRRYDAVRQVEALPARAARGPRRPRGRRARCWRARSATRSSRSRFWLPESGVHADAAGRTVEPRAGPDRAITPLTRGGVPLGVVVHDQSLAERRVLLEPVLQAAGLPIEIARLRVELRRQLAEVAGLARRGSSPRATRSGGASSATCTTARSSAWSPSACRCATSSTSSAPSANGAATALDDAVDEVGRAIGDLRELARGVRPARLDDGLAPALRELADRTPLRVEVDATAERFPPEIEATAYFVASEAMANAVKHAHASTHHRPGRPRRRAARR